MKSNLLRLNLQDLGHGFIMAVGVVFIAPLLPILQTGAFPDTATIKSSLGQDLPRGWFIWGRISLQIRRGKSANLR
ncbi:MAG: hypothetical protein WAN57_09625 [Smithella sp.]